MTAETEQPRVTRRYDRLARVYDLHNEPMELFGLAARRRRLVRLARGSALEVGIGTGRNLEHYQGDVRLTGIDISPRMLERARRRAVRLGRDVDLGLADVQHLPFPDGSFDTIVAACVFCSVPDPVRGLVELGRVAKPGGTMLLLEHVRPRNRAVGWLADLLSPVTRRVFGFNLNRRTEENVAAAGLEIREVRRQGIWREMEAVTASVQPRAREGSSGMGRAFTGTSQGRARLPGSEREREG